MYALTVKNLCKEYPKFKLNNVSFELEKGKITGFIGRNGAGKSTTLKSMLNFVHPDSGEISFFGKSFENAENEIKQKIGFVSGGINYYSTKKIRTITSVTKRFYPDWDEKAYERYMALFKLDESKTPAQLSEGMKVKYSLVLALSHKAELLILDEPTSGLDTVSRDELLDVFLELENDGITILFSTHITSDLDKCADNIIYIKNGSILANGNTDTFVSEYKTAELDEAELTEEIKPLLIGCKREKHGYCALVKSENANKVKGKISDADLEAIMIHLEKEE